ncbi:flagellar biosynthetic protein FliO [Hydrogenophaga sp. OTU3427]|uniref:flagellar biosynthetic protein FliO n=1 Tax=Hydrogenophaga sp. OTU3427 TaxID=3043856 RepID=UPI00313BF57F
MTPDTMPSFTPALLLLGLLVLAAWGVKWLRQRYAIGGTPDAQAIRVISSLAVGPQQRVLVLELTEPGSQARHLLTVGVTPGQITTLHSTTPATPSYGTVAARQAPPAP